ncbi:dnaJ homolog subfamily B member 2 [Jatropha curcas]|uniref:dnaJ homolog subfamily B member 2 n=1 Tax=Jatropha curcas TaxID=180498 RepID=UPI001894400A|nr:dnaJ homolog subfamily B member 2 [Jatropha curcas]
MADGSHSPISLDFHSILGISKGAPVKEMCKAYKFLVKKWHPDRNPSNKTEAQAKLQQINEAFMILNEKKIKESTKTIDYEPITSPLSDLPSGRTSSHRQKKSMDESFFSRPSVHLKSLRKKSRTPSPTPTYLSQNASRRSISPAPDTSRSKSTGKRCTPETKFSSLAKSRTPSPTPADLSQSASRRSISPAPDTSRSKSTGKRCTPETKFSSLAKSRTPSPTPADLSQSASRRSISPAPDTSRSKSTGKRCTPETKFSSLAKSRTPSPTPADLSQSASRRSISPAPSLEELCRGCIKKVKITRSFLRNGIIDQEEEVLKIRVQPGWKKGTKITFEGKGDEKPGYHPADIILVVEEKRHPLFEREGDDLELALKIPLVKALTGCSISVPLLGGEKMCLSFDDIIYPGFEKVIRGQGMPTTEEGKRGDLRIKFFVEFPIELSDEQRTQASSILQDCFSC